ncbi:MAG: PilZ domain-containing protein [Brevinematales bacterium]|jgi:hypothetical protein
MKMLFYEHFLNNMSDLTIDLIPMGLECIDCLSQDEFFNCLKSSDSPATIMMTGTKEIGLFKQIREISPSINIFYVVKNTTKTDLIKSFAPFCITAIINFTESSVHMADEIVRAIVSHNISTKDKRVHIRVRPIEPEIITSAVCIKEINRFIKGKVIDISAGGCAIKFDNHEEVSLLSPKTVYDPLLLKIDGTGIKALATLVAIHNNAAGFHFDNVEPVQMRRLANYIYRKISENK